ncbi:MAG: hypothetical protein J7J14_07645 [Thermotogaceae bacterium]|nr:hypothetical protein [Thermotogaceae bacterium]
MRRVWNDRLNRILDGEEKFDESDENLKNELRIYKRIIEVYSMKLDYRPSDNLKDKILKKIEKRRKLPILIFSTAGITALFLILFFQFFFTSSPNLSPTIVEIPNKVKLNEGSVASFSNDLVEVLKTIELVSDGF